MCSIYTEIIGIEKQRFAQMQHEALLENMFQWTVPVHCEAIWGSKKTKLLQFLSYRNGMVLTSKWGRI